MRWSLAVAAGLLTIACGEPSPNPQGPSPAEALELRSQTAHFRIFAGQASALYENGELVQPRTLDYMARGAYPPCSS